MQRSSARVAWLRCRHGRCNKRLYEECCRQDDVYTVLVPLQCLSCASVVTAQVLACTGDLTPGCHLWCSSSSRARHAESLPVLMQHEAMDRGHGRIIPRCHGQGRAGQMLVAMPSTQLSRRLVYVRHITRRQSSEKNISRRRHGIS